MKAVHQQGGAIYAYDSATVTLTQCSLSRNTAKYVRLPRPVPSPPLPLLCMLDHTAQAVRMKGAQNSNPID